MATICANSASRRARLPSTMSAPANGGFSNISLSLDRPRGGGVAVSSGRENPEQPWGSPQRSSRSATATASIQLEARHVLANDLFARFALGDGSLQTNLRYRRACAATSGRWVPQALTGRVVADAGFISDANGDDGRIDSTAPSSSSIGMRQTTFCRCRSRSFRRQSDYDARTGRSAGRGARAMVVQDRRRHRRSGFARGNGRSADPQSHRAERQFDPVKQRFVLDQGDLGNNDVGVAMSGSRGLFQRRASSAAGFAGTRMPAEHLKRLWPVFRCSQSARLVRRTSGQWHRRAPGDWRECAARIRSKRAVRRSPMMDCRLMRWPRIASSGR